MEKKTVLIIDDDSRNIFALAAVLRAKGFQVLSAQSATEGFILLKQNKGINVVLMDIMMPGVDGYEAIGLIRSDGELAATKVIAVTAQAMVGDREKAISAGADAYISKPVDVDQLLGLLHKY